MVDGALWRAPFAVVFYFRNRTRLVTQPSQPFFMRVFITFVDVIL